MKAGGNAKQRREAEASRRKEIWARERAEPEKERTGKTPVKADARKAVHIPEKTPDPAPPAPRREEPRKTEEEETREFLAYLERHDIPVPDDEPVRRTGKKNSPADSIPGLNLEAGMPFVSEAADRMRMGIQEMRHSQVKIVKLIHGYGSTGRGGKIRAGIRAELAEMKKKKLIRDFIPGEEFGPMDAASRKLADQYKSVSRDPDYGRINHGITIVAL